ncbi:MAG TPA: response regulator [Polyangiaceae bacterium]|jgi:two-component system response regulator|nr:response regulator [Polyangiaceae bacterium]
MNKDVILLVEDNDDDADLTRMAFQEAKISNPIVRAKDGVEALDYLFGRGSHQGRDARMGPVVVLLDLKMPRLGGLEVLKEIRTSASTRHLPVVVLTSSDEDKDRLTAYDHHVNSYVRKPVDYDQFVAATRQLGLYWTVTNVPPPKVT